MILQTHSPEETQGLAQALGRVLRDGDFVSLTGSLGAGKTHFSQGVGVGLDVVEALTSPTFNIVFEYSSGRILLYHFDLYRLEDALELEDIDFYALADSDTPGASLVEWADRFPEELPEDRLEVVIEHAAGGDSERTIEATATGSRSEELLALWHSALEAA